MLRASVTRIAALAAVVMVAVTLAGCGVNNIPTYEQNAKAKW
jgi:LemA protein